MSFLAELRRRNVIRMAGLYLVGAWLIVQVAATLLPVFEAPGWVMKTLVALLVIGFVPALIISWVFELTPDGLRREDESAPAEPSDSNVSGTAQRMNRMIIVVMLLGLSYFGVDKFVLAPKRDAALVASTALSAQAQAIAVSQVVVNDNSIAVMPFVNMSSDKEQEYFSDGMTEELLNVLAKMPQMKVVARTSVFEFKDKGGDIRDIGRKLGVAHIIEGSVRRDGQQVRVTAQLVRVSDGFHAWSETYDRKLESVFALRGEFLAFEDVAKGAG